MGDVGNLPVEVSGFVGRMGELRTGLRLLSEARLVTVTGPAGVGKSRVAVKLAESSRRRLPGGAWYVELSHVAPPGTRAAADRGAAMSATVAAVAAALGAYGVVGEVRASAERGGVAEPSGRPGEVAGGVAKASGRAGEAAAEAVDGVVNGVVDRAGDTAVAEVVGEAVARVVGDMRALIVLDTCDHLLDVVGPLTAALLRAAPRLRIVVTSRRPLGVAWERAFTVPPLPADRAVGLFRERGQAVDPEFTLTPRMMPVAREICRRLDGLPLAIELAAARLRSLSVAELLARLDDRFDLLSGVTRTALERHQGLRAALEWGYELCDARQRALWARLSVFPGDFGVTEAESVCAGGILPRESVAPTLSALVAGSIVIREGARHRLLDSFRRYGVLRLRELGEGDFAGRARRTATAAPATVAGGTVMILPDAPVRPALPVAGTLSGRQLQVARLITEGLSNPKIAERLMIARRTVDAHVRNILTKGGLTSRTQVATWLAAEMAASADPGSAFTRRGGRG